MNRLYSTVLFPELEKELRGNRELLGDVRGYCVVSVSRKDNKETWFPPLSSVNRLNR